jgi:septal ring factor EnvC (AmiA/AmiB activator)
MDGKSNRGIGEVLEQLEAQAAFHRQREAFHAEHEARHREQRTAHAAELEEILRRLEAFRAAAAEAVDLADRQGAAPSVQSLEEDDVGSRSRPRIHSMLEKIIADQGAGERFGPLGLTGELNRRFGQRLRRPVKANQVSAALRRLEQKGIVRLVQKGRPHSEALYERTTSPQPLV